MFQYTWSVVQMQVASVAAHEPAQVLTQSVRQVGRVELSCLARRVKGVA
jgi:hypothetical protein